MTSDILFKETFSENLVNKSKYCFLLFSSTVLLSMRLGIDVNRHKVSDVKFFQR